MPIHSTSPPLDHLPHASAALAPLGPVSEAGMSEAAGLTKPAEQLVDPRVLQGMEGDFLDAAVVERFVRDFSATLDGKIDRLGLRIHDGDRTAMQDAVRSVATSAAMVGAPRLRQAALATERHVAADDVEAAHRSIALLRACGADTVQELQETYLAER